MSGIPCMICQRPNNPQACEYCPKVSVCIRCYNLTHKHTQTHKHRVFSREGTYEEPLPDEP
jgi:hypothetical protein